MKENVDKTAEAKRKYSESFPELWGRLEREGHPRWTDGPLPVDVTKEEVCEHCDPEGFSGRNDVNRDLYAWCGEHGIWECNRCRHGMKLILTATKREQVDWTKARPIMKEALSRVSKEAVTLRPVNES